MRTKLKKKKHLTNHDESYDEFVQKENRGKRKAKVFKFTTIYKFNVYKM